MYWEVKQEMKEVKCTRNVIREWEGKREKKNFAGFYAYLRRYIVGMD